MSLDLVFPLPDFSTTEEDVVIQAMQIPAVRAYLSRMAVEDTKELLALSAIETDPMKISRAHAVVQGKLQVLTMLLAIAVQ